MRLLRKLNIIIDDSNHTKAGKLYNTILISLITLNVIAIIIESFPLSAIQERLLKYFEVLSIIIFSLDYLGRVATAHVRNNQNSTLKATIKFILSPLGLIDLLSILPYYLPLLLPIDLRFLRLLRIFRVMRIFKLNRYYNFV